MTRSCHGIVFFACVCLLGLLLGGCESGDERSTLGGWTLEEVGLTLADTLRVSGTEAFYFGSVAGMDVTNDGHILVADRSAHNVKILRPDGTLLDTLGRQGNGPGEFQGLLDVQIARGDSLYAYDAQQSRLTVFAPDSPYEVARTIDLSREGGYPIRIQILDEHVVAEFSAVSPPEGGVSRSSPRTWRMIDGSGTPRDTVLHTPGPKMVMGKTSSGVRLQMVPYTSATSEAWGPDGRLFHGWTDSLHIEARSLTGASEVIASIPTEPVPLTSSDRDSLVAGTGGEMRAQMASALPGTKPAFTQMIVDDDGRVWVWRPPGVLDAETRMVWVLDPVAKTIQELQLSQEVSIRAVKNDRIYGSTTTEAGAPAVVRYRIRTSS